ncbi:hypothetical protein [Priestia filamentosa]|nr:hypothetical protein [Priestia filamentosa]
MDKYELRYFCSRCKVEYDDVEEAIDCCIEVVKLKQYYEEEE